MLLVELIQSDSDRELESALRAALSARKAGSITTVGFNQLAKSAGLTSLSKSAFDNFVANHPELSAGIEQTSDNGIALADPDAEPEMDMPDDAEQPADDSAPPADGAADDVAMAAGAEDGATLAPDAMDDIGGLDLTAGTNTGAPMTPSSRVSPNQGNAITPHPQEYNTVQKSAQRALGRRV
jgi:hypothetical protein